jgi:hypothetical protein
VGRTYAYSQNGKATFTTEFEGCLVQSTVIYRNPEKDKAQID